MALSYLSDIATSFQLLLIRKGCSLFRQRRTRFRSCNHLHQITLTPIVTKSSPSSQRRLLIPRAQTKHEVRISSPDAQRKQPRKKQRQMKGNCIKKIKKSTKWHFRGHQELQTRTTTVKHPSADAWAEITSFYRKKEENGTLTNERDSSIKNRTEQNRTLYFDREVSVHIYKYIHIQHSYASSNRTLCIN